MTSTATKRWIAANKKAAPASISPSAMAMGNDPADIDNLPRALRGCVHEFGWSVVRTFLDHGVRNPNAIRALVHTVWQGPREAANARSAKVDGSCRSLAVFDDFLIRSDCHVNARALIGLFRHQDLVVLRREPSDEMAETAGVPKPALRKAIRAEERMLWPFLYA